MTGWPKKLSRLKEETFVVNKFYTAWKTIGAINFNESGGLTRARSNAESDFKSHRLNAGQPWRVHLRLVGYLQYWGGGRQELERKHA